LVKGGGGNNPAIQPFIMNYRQAQALTQDINEPMGKLLDSVKYIGWMVQFIDAMNGNDKAGMDLSLAIAKSMLMDTLSGISKSTKIAFFAVSFIDYALTTFISSTLDDYHEFWWQAYSTYLEKRYPNLVHGKDSWAALAEQEGGNVALNARLIEFWTGTAEGTTLDLATIYYKTPTLLQRDALANATDQKKFASVYYTERLKPTLTTYFHRQAEDLIANATAIADPNCQKIADLVATMTALRVAVIGARCQIHACQLQDDRSCKDVNASCCSTKCHQCLSGQVVEGCLKAK
jgi:hypothetical protein